MFGYSIHLRLPTACALCAYVLCLSGPARADLVWEDQFTDGDVISSGTVVNTPGLDVTITNSITGNPTAPRGNFFLYRDGPAGNHTGYLDMNMDTDQNNRNDQLFISFAFGGMGADNLQLSLLDIDTGSWDDGVEIQYTSTTGAGDVRDDPSLYSLPPGFRTVFLDNEANMHGFEGGNANAGVTDEWGNLALDFTGLTITSLSITFFSTDDAASDPGAQFIGISDFGFTAATPEPSSLSLLLLAMAIVAVRRPVRDARPA